MVEKLGSDSHTSESVFGVNVFNDNDLMICAPDAPRDDWFNFICRDGQDGLAFREKACNQLALAVEIDFFRH